MKRRFIVKSLICLGMGVAPLPVFGAAVPTPETKPNPELAKSLSDHYAKLEESMRQLPRNRFDPTAVVEQVGQDPAKLTAWVRDQTDALPYRGALRGSAGVLMDRGGNSLDRSLLLAEMLQAAGFDVRLANATLTPDQAAAELQQIRQSGRKNGVAAAKKGPELSAEDAKRREAARQKVRDQTDRVLAVIQTQATGSVADEAMKAAVADCWWVQYSQGDNWVDASLTVTAPPAAARTVPIKSNSRSLPLAPADCHEVELRVVIEAFRGGKLTTEPVVKQTFRSAESLGQSISVVHLPGKAPKADDLAPGADAARRLKESLVKQEVYLPAIMIDGRAVVDASFTTAGEVDHDPKLDPAGKLGNSFAKTMGGFAGGLTGSEPAKQEKGVLTAEWIEYEMRIPGQKPQTLRRPIFDLIGPAQRAAGVKQAPQITADKEVLRALYLAGSTDVLLQPCALPPEFVSYRMARSSLKEKPVMLAVARGQIKNRQQYVEAMSRLAGVDAVTPALAMIRDGLDLTDGQTFIDRANIIDHRVWLEEAGGDLVQRRGIDLAFLSTAALPAGPAGFKARLERGVADTLAEHEILAGAGAPLENTIGVMEASAAKGGATLVASNDAAALAKLQLPPDVAARAAEDLAAGNVLLLASAEPGRWSWWRVDPQTGQTVGVMDNGYHASMMERLQGELNSLYATLGVALTPAAMKAATYQQMWQWAGKQGFLFTDLWEIQQECIVALEMLSFKRG